MRISKSLFLTACFTFAVLSVRADNRQVIDSLKTQLAVVKTPADSINILYNIYDLSPRDVRGEIGEQLYCTAGNAGRHEVQFDIIRNNAMMYIHSDSIMDRYLSMVNSFPESDGKSETLAFLEITRSSDRIRMMPEEKRLDEMQKFMARYTKMPPKDPYDRVVALYKICVFIGASSHGDLYDRYIDKLEKAIDELPAGHRDIIRNMYLVQVAMIHTSNENYKKSVAADKKLLEVINSLKERYLSQGRLYRNYDVNEYICYRRLLGNFPALTADEIEEYYSRIKALAQRNPFIAENIDSNGRADIYYLMATGNYAEALPMLKKYRDVADNKLYRRKFLRYYMVAARESGDKEALLDATMAYNEQLEEYIKLQASEKYKELQIIYDVNGLKAQGARADKERRNSERALHGKIIMILAIAIIILAIMLIVVGRMYMRSKRLVRKLATSKNRLQADKRTLLRTQQDLMIARDQSESLSRVKTQFLKNMRRELLVPLNSIVGYSQLIADFVAPERQAEVAKYTRIINDNNDLLLNLLADTLDLSMIDAGEMPVKIEPCLLSDLCRDCVDKFKDRVSPDVKMEFIDPGDDFVLNTDKERTEKILSNYLNNAIKFTEKGSITLTYQVTDDRRQVIFSVTDTGIGIPASKHTIIFERFERLDTSVPGVGLGLHICQLSARMLGGIAKVDPSYKTGARFLFIHPVKDYDIDDAQGTELSV